MSSFKAYLQQRQRAGIHQTSPEASPSGEGQTNEGQGFGQTSLGSEPTTYENARDASPVVPDAVRRTWQAADREEQLLRQQVDALLNDETLVPEVKAERARELYESKSNAIAEKRQQTREALLKAADAAYRASIPVYSGQALAPADTNALLADQNEAARIVRTVKSKEEKSGPYGFRATDYVREEYARALAAGGIEGGSILRGCIRASEELGLDIEDVLSGVRSERHREYVDKSRRLAHFADMLSTKVPELPRRTRDRLQRLARGSTSSRASAIGAQRSSHALVGGAGQPIAQSQGSHNQGSSQGSSSKRKKRSFK